jgi:hypothetical protein
MGAGYLIPNGWNETWNLPIGKAILQLFSHNPWNHDRAGLRVDTVLEYPDATIYEDQSP